MDIDSYDYDGSSYLRLAAMIHKMVRISTAGANIGLSAVVDCTMPGPYIAYVMLGVRSC